MVLTNILRDKKICTNQVDPRVKSGVEWGRVEFNSWTFHFLLPYVRYSANSNLTHTSASEKRSRLQCSSWWWIMKSLKLAVQQRANISWHYYLRQAGYVLASICLLVGWLVCQSEALIEKLKINFVKFLTEVGFETRNNHLGFGWSVNPGPDPVRCDQRFAES